MIHKSVLPDEVLHHLGCGKNKNFIDATVGGGGHSELILEATAPNGLLVGFERDPNACQVALRRLKDFGGRFRLVEENFADLDSELRRLNVSGFDGILFDLGMSSMQIEDPERGFSFSKDGPLDMRMDTRLPLTAETVINEYDEDLLAKIFIELGEERFGRGMARRIAGEREKSRIASTLQLARIIEKSVPARFRPKSIHPATRAFMALRIFVNGELDNLRKGLADSVGFLKSGGRIAAISFHSLEDRIVKRFFGELNRGCTCPADLPGCVCGKKPRLKIVTRKPVMATASELRDNPRSRSAKLRVAEVI